MPLYYLHVLSDEGPEFDMEGVEYSDVEEARSGAKRAAREILADMIRSGQIINQLRFEMIDEDNNLVISIPGRALIQFE